MTSSNNEKTIEIMAFCNNVDSTETGLWRFIWNAIKSEKCNLTSHNKKLLVVLTKYAKES